MPASLALRTFPIRSAARLPPFSSGRDIFQSGGWLANDDGGALRVGDARRQSLFPDSTLVNTSRETGIPASGTCGQRHPASVAPQIDL